MAISDWGHRGGNFGEIPSFFSEFCRKVAHLLGWKYKLEQVLPRWFWLISVKILSEMPGIRTNSGLFYLQCRSLAQISFIIIIIRNNFCIFYQFIAS